MPRNISVVPLDSKSVKIEWIFSESLENGFIDGFYIGHRIALSSEQFTFNTMHVRSAGPEVELPGSGQDGVSGFSENPEKRRNKHYHNVVHSLRRSSKYAFIVQAFNKEGEGPYSDQIFAQTFANGK